MIRFADELRPRLSKIENAFIVQPKFNNNRFE
jgi:hypothetical protein